MNINKCLLYYILSTICVIYKQTKFKNKVGLTMNIAFGQLFIYCFGEKIFQNTCTGTCIHV